MSDDAVPAEKPAKPPKRPPTQRGPGGRGYSKAARKEMAAFVIELRKSEPMMRYAEVNRRIRERFGCGHSVAEKVITEASERLVDLFYEAAGDAPRMVLDGYMEIYDEAMRQGNLGQARKTLDSVRDMFGIKGATNININIGGRSNDAATALEKYEHLSLEELEVLAKLDIVPTKVLDVPSAEDALDVAAAGDDIDDLPEPLP